mgnify:CR=1 FL=1
MSSSSLLQNKILNRFQSLSGLPNTSILPKVGDIYSTDIVKIQFDKQDTSTFPPTNISTIDWVGKINIEILNVTENGNLFNIQSKISFENTNNSEINIPDILSNDLDLNILKKSLNVIDLRTNIIILKYSNQSLTNRYNIITNQGNVFLNDLRLSLSLLIVDYNNHLSYESLAYLTLSK